ncbi:LysR substrate-binding domain-containing protein [Klebsiella pneumoniae]|uniref:LysR substrate-binding domain-containing protein n=1 Tax=Klebsiella pneumoniae TaxID=573 RepID=UPI003EB9DA65
MASAGASDCPKIHAVFARPRSPAGNISLALPVIQNAAPPITTLLKKFKKASPLVGITLHHLISEVQLSKIAEGELDAGFLLFRPLNDPLFAGIPVFKEKMLLAYPTEWKWPDNKEPRYLRELQNLDFIWLPRTAAPAWHDRLIHCFYDAGLKWSTKTGHRVRVFPVSVF